MALTTTITPEDIATALGLSAPDSDSVRFKQWAQWIDDALWLVRRRVTATSTPEGDIDAETLDYVIRLAVEARAERPKGGASQRTVAVDDGSTTNTYSRARRTPDVEIDNEWWQMLGLAKRAGRASNVDLMPPGAGIGGDRTTYWWAQ